MKHSIIAVLAAIALFLGGCAGGPATIPLSAIAELPEGVKDTAVTVANASVAKEGMVFKSWQVYHKQYAKAYKDSGFSMEFAMVDVAPGVKAYMPTSINYREEPDMLAPPKEPSKHPAWQFASDTIGTVAKYGLIGWGISEVSGVLKAGYDAVGNTYAGPVQYVGSHNTAGDDQEISATAAEQPFNYGDFSSEDGANLGGGGGTPGGGTGGSGCPYVGGSCGPNSYQDVHGVWWFDPSISCASRCD